MKAWRRVKTIWADAYVVLSENLTQIPTLRKIAGERASESVCVCVCECECKCECVCVSVCVSVSVSVCV